MFKRGVLAEQSFWIKALTLLGIEFLTFCLGSFLGFAGSYLLFSTPPLALQSLVEDPFALPNGVAILQFLQFTQAISLFVIAPLFFVYLVAPQGQTFIAWKGSPKRSFWWTATIITFVASPVITLLVNINEAMQLPAFLSSMESWMKEQEASAKTLTDAFLSGTTIADLFLNILIVGVLAGLGEELFFRGVLQKLIADHTKKIHLSIFVTAVLFSAIHMQFYGFLPRLALGMLLGYLYHWSGSLWVSILAHSVNNSLAVIASYLYKQGTISLNPDDESLMPWYIILISLLLTGTLVYQLHKNRRVDSLWQD